MSAAIRPALEVSTSESLSFFGVSGSSQGAAPWFRPERLSDPDFSVDAYVSELRQYAPLEALSAELEKYLASLKSKVRETIHKICARRLALIWLTQCYDI